MIDRRRLGELIRQRKLNPENGLPRNGPKREAARDPGFGEELRTCAGVCLRREERLEGLPVEEAGLALAAGLAYPQERRVLEAAGAPVGPGDCLFLDLETCGFAGTPLFLAGLADCTGATVRLVQYFARDYSEEAAVVEAVRGHLESARLLVSFNGRSYDMPFLAERAARLGLGTLPEVPHLDLLHAARRRWRDVLPDCRLQTLESRFRGPLRAGDVPGWEVPGRYHDYVRGGNAALVRPVLGHNRLDLATLVVILARMAGGDSERAAQA